MITKNLKDEKEILALTGLRFMAAFYVFVFHIHIRWPVTSGKFLSNVLGQGAIGMSLFFILSGFVLAYRYAEENVPLKSYFVNRFARIYPVYAVTALLTLPWIGLSLGEGSLTDVFRLVLQGILLLFANVFLIQAWFPQFFSYWNDGGSWSISVEAFCYLLLPFLLPFLIRLSLKRLLQLAIIFYVLAVVPGLVGFVFPTATSGIYYSMPIYRLPEFLLGVCGYIAFRNGLGTNLKQRYQFMFLAVLLTYIGIFGSKIPNYVGHNWIVLPFIVFMIVTLSSGKGLLASVLSNSFFVWLGKISYCFYSFQVLLILVLISYHDQLVVLFPHLTNNKLFLLFALLVLLLISALAYYLVEEPARRRIKQFYASKRASAH